MNLNKKSYEIIGFFGGVCFVFGVGFYLIRRELSFYVLLNILLGIALLGVFLYFNIKEIVKLFHTSDIKGSRRVLTNTGFVIAVVILINMFSGLFYIGADLTKDKVTSVSQQSQKIIKWIKDPVKIMVFSTSDNNDFEKYLLDSYNFHNRKITYEFLDPERNPQLAQKYKIKKTGQAVVKHNEGFIVVDNVSEHTITNAIIKLTQKIQNAVYFLQMHGEHVIDDFKSNQGYGLLWKQLIDENYAVRILKLEPPNYYIPGRCTILVIAGPRNMYTQMEVKAIREYIENNGRCVFLLDPYVNTGLEELLEEWGVKIENDCVVDVVKPSLIEKLIARMKRIKLNPYPILQVIVRDFPEHEITKELVDKSCIMSVTRSLSGPEKEKIRMDQQVEPLAYTTDKGWGETDLDRLFKRGEIWKTEDEKRGPLCVAMLSSRGMHESSGKIIVIGDSDFVNNEYINQLYNKDFFMNCMAYLGRQADFISVRPRHLFASRLDYNPKTMTRIFTISVLIFPQLFLMTGIAIWWLRR